MHQAAGLAFLFVLIMLHQLDGTIIWIESAQLQIIKARSVCEGRAGAGIRVGGTSLCVLETADQIREKLLEAGVK